MNHSVITLEIKTNLFNVEYVQEKCECKYVSTNVYGVRCVNVRYKCML